MKIFLPFLILAFSFLTAAPCDHATISIYAVDTTTGEVLRDENSDKSLIPGSCMKIVTTAAALHLLGPEGRFQTDLEYDGTIDQGVLHGNIYIRGGGDPCLGSDRISSSLSWDKQIEAWAAAIQQLGIQKIEGDVFGDAAKWEKACAVPSWAWEDLGNYYGAGASALTFHENMYALFFTPGKEVGAAAAIARTDPVISTIAFQNEVTTGPVGSGDQACIFGSELSSVHAVRGTVPAGVDEFSIKGAIPDPAKYCAQLLSQGLAAKGIAIGHKNVQPGKRTVFHATYSPTVKEIVHRTNQKSHNLYAEHLMKKIGEIVNKEGSTAAGTRAIAAFWGEQNIDLGGFNMADGSGLSRKNLVTAKQLVSILLQMKKSDLFPIFLESLPQQNEMIRAKPGSMSLVKGFAGYAGDVAFAILINQCLDAQQANEKINQFFVELMRIGKTDPQIN